MGCTTKDDLSGGGFQTSGGLDDSVLWASVSSLSQPPLLLSNGLTNKAAMLAGLEVRHRLSKRDSCSMQKLTTLQTCHLENRPG